ncbi:hypothetical protein WKW79_03630 [Variovorax robiniae]|uniref:Uncharacterized protein n=1 Tax=Variovorax robiniae TaxID=1836199 RepID=A0ABU8X1N5_9BURK
MADTETPPPAVVTAAQRRAMAVRSALVVAIWLAMVALLLLRPGSVGQVIALGFVAVCITLYDAPLMRRLAKEKLLHPDRRKAREE